MATAMKEGKKSALLTVPTIEGLQIGEWATDKAVRGEGRLVARRLATGHVMFYFRYVTGDGRRDTLRVGTFDKHGRHGLTLAAARAKVAEYRRTRQQDGDIRATWQAEQRERDREQSARESAEQAAKEAELAKRTRTFGVLLTAYADQLERDGKMSARSVRSELHHHVRDKWPKLWSTPVADITPDDLLAVVAVPVEAGHLRQAEKVRAYLRAAFAAGMKARHNAKALPALRALRIAANPARDLTPIEGANRARERALSMTELRAYWMRIQAPHHAALRFHLLTGCQRIEQLARVTQTDFDTDTNSIRMLDYKGRRPNPRPHHVPLTPAAIDAMRAMHAGTAGPHLFTLTAGESGADYSGISKRIGVIRDAMQQDGELPGGAFTPGDLRRTVETILAGQQVSKDTRGHLQSHGLDGVQARHYDKHTYMVEKRDALEKVYRLLTDSSAEAGSSTRKA